MGAVSGSLHLVSLGNLKLQHFNFRILLQFSSSPTKFHCPTQFLRQIKGILWAIVEFHVSFRAIGASEAEALSITTQDIWVLLAKHRCLTQWKWKWSLKSRWSSTKFPSFDFHCMFLQWLPYRTRCCQYYRTFADSDQEKLMKCFEDSGGVKRQRNGEDMALILRCTWGQVSATSGL